MKHEIRVDAVWDDDAKVWVATSPDVRGLAVEAATLDRLLKKVVPAIEDLIELNGIESDLSEIPVHICSHARARVPNPCH